MRPDSDVLRGKTVAVDFDHTLHAYTSGWTGPVPKDPPMPGAQQFVRDLIAAGAEVIVLTTRAATEEGLVATQRWLEQYGFPDGLRVTCEKVPAIAYVDDRAVRFDAQFGSTAWAMVRLEVERLAGVHHGSARG